MKATRKKIAIQKLLNILFYYLISFLGFIIFSGLIYNRFIIERVPKDIPILLTEYYFWILLYLCCIYLYIIKTLIKPKSLAENTKIILDILYMPLTTLDTAIKKNIYIYKSFYELMDNLISFLDALKIIHYILFVIMFQIIPRGILVYVLFLDTFVYHRIEIFYKIVLIGLIPLINRYIIYTIRNFIEYYIEKLESKYNSVWMFDNAYSNPPEKDEDGDEIDWVVTEENKFHNKHIPIKEYIEYKTRNNSTVNYIETVYAKEETYIKYHKDNDIPLDTKLTAEDYLKINKDFVDILSKIFIILKLLNLYSEFNNKYFIKGLKIIIFGLYFIYWSYILIISYYNEPIEFPNTVIRLLETLRRIENPFSGVYYENGE